MDIRKYVVDFYEKLFLSEFQERPEVAQSFYEGLPKVSKEANMELDAPISADELYSALQSLESGKSPGIDGLPLDFNKVFWPGIGKDLLLVLRDSLSTKLFTLSHRRAILALLLSWGDFQEIKNRQPVARLCTDYKPLSKVLATSPRNVHVDQTYSIHPIG